MRRPAPPFLHPLIPPLCPMLPTTALPPAVLTRSAADVLHSRPTAGLDTAAPALDPFVGFLETYWGFD